MTFADFERVPGSFEANGLHGQPLLRKDSQTSLIMHEENKVNHYCEGDLDM